MALVVPKSGPKTLSAAANLANLLPTGTVLAFQAIIPLFSNNGNCHLVAYKYLTLSVLLCCSIACVLSTFMDSFIGSDNNGKVKLYYGIATTKGMYIFSKDENYDDDEEKGEEEKALVKYRIHLIDFVHAFVSLIVFLVFAISSTDVKSCLFPDAGANTNVLLMNSPLGVGVVASFVFMLIPTKRRGIGYADMAQWKEHENTRIHVPSAENNSQNGDPRNIVTTIHP